MIILPIERNNPGCRDLALKIYVGPYNGEQNDQMAPVPNEA
jgi:hypothetical protein